jgi:hypothetical protein
VAHIDERCNEPNIFLGGGGASAWFAPAAVLSPFSAGLGTPFLLPTDPDLGILFNPIFNPDPVPAVVAAVFFFGSSFGEGIPGWGSSEGDRIPCFSNTSETNGILVLYLRATEDQNLTSDGKFRIGELLYYTLELDSFQNYAVFSPTPVTVP